jgi:uncharacterized membrane protein
MMLEIVRIVVGLPLALFIPGFLVALIAFGELSWLEKIALGFVLSICIDITVGLLLGYNLQMKDLTGGITALNLWLYLGSISVVLAVVLFYQNAFHHKIRKHKPDMTRQ